MLKQAQDVQGWLKRACKAAVDGPLAGSADDYACAREQAFPAAEADNAYRHLRTADYSDAVAALPPEELQVRMQLTAILMPASLRKCAMHVCGILQPACRGGKTLQDDACCLVAPCRRR
jgi:hypothetical protein